MANVRTLKVGDTPRGRRVWLEGKYLLPAGFVPAARFNATFAPGRMVLTLDPTGDRTVSDKRGVPVIDIIGASVALAFPTADRCAVAIGSGRIVLTPAA